MLGKGKKMLALSNDDVLEVLTASACIEEIEKVYNEANAGNAATSPRAEYSTPIDRQGEHHTFAVHDGVSRGAGVAALRLRSDVIVHHGDRDVKYCIEPGTYCGLIFLFDIDDGAPLAMLNDAIVQQMRVGATAAVAAKYMCRPDAATLGILGSGNQARTHAAAYAEVLPLEKIRVYSPSRENREAFAQETSDKLGIEVEPVGTAEEAVRGSDLVAACTISNDPVLDAEWLDAGTYVSSIRHWSEVGPDLHERADRIVVHQPPELNWYTLGDDEAWAKARTPIGEKPSGSLTAIGEQRDRVVPTDSPLLLDVMAGRATGRAGDDEITYFLNNFGTGLQFAACAGYAYRRAVERGLGTELPIELFLEDLRD